MYRRLTGLKLAESKQRKAILNVETPKTKHRLLNSLSFAAPGDRCREIVPPDVAMREAQC